MILGGMARYNIGIFAKAPTPKKKPTPKKEPTVTSSVEDNPLWDRGRESKPDTPDPFELHTGSPPPPAATVPLGEKSPPPKSSVATVGNGGTSKAGGSPDASERTSEEGLVARGREMLDDVDAVSSNAALALGGVGGALNYLGKFTRPAVRFLSASNKLGGIGRGLGYTRAAIDVANLADEKHQESMYQTGKKMMDKEPTLGEAAQVGFNMIDPGQIGTNTTQVIGMIGAVKEQQASANASVQALKDQQFRAERQKKNKKEHPWTYGYGRDPIPGKDAFEEQADRLESEAAKKAFGGDESMDESMDEWSPPTIDFPESSTAEAKGGYGKRPDGSDKGKGYLGELKLPNGGVATEFSTQSDAVKDANGERIDFPSIVPTLTAEETKLMTDEIIPNNKAIPEPIMQKAINHANMMLEKGEGVFFDSKTDNEEKEDFALELETKDMIKAALSRSKEQP